MDGSTLTLSFHRSRTPRRHRACEGAFHPRDYSGSKALTVAEHLSNIGASLVPIGASLVPNNGGCSRHVPSLVVAIRSPTCRRNEDFCGSEWWARQGLN